MRTSEVAALSNPIDRFLYWIEERQSIYLKRRAGRPRPWTDDEVLQRYFFTNPYRENDKTTIWFRDHIREPLRDSPSVLFATICFRWFNYIKTGELLQATGLLTNWDEALALQHLGQLRATHGKVFTGAFIVKSPNGIGKLEGIADKLTYCWKRQDTLLQKILAGKTLQQAWMVLKELPYMGRFTSYEVVTDLRWTYLLDQAPDINTWCNLGPGARRGMVRLLGGTLGKNKRGRERNGVPLPPDWQPRVLHLLDLVRTSLQINFELRDVEHSLCEWDKYERLLWGQGKSKRTYNGGC